MMTDQIDPSRSGLRAALEALPKHYGILLRDNPGQGDKSTWSTHTMVKLADVSALLTGAVWVCGARAATDPPQDCNWPLCGCDPYADKVIAALQEGGALRSVKDLPDSLTGANHAQEPANVDDLRWTHRLAGSVLRSQHRTSDDPFETCSNTECVRWRELRDQLTGVTGSAPSDPPAQEPTIEEVSGVLRHEQVNYPAAAVRPDPPQWQDIATAPKEGTFLVYGAFMDGKLPMTMVADGKLLALSRLGKTPAHLSGSHWTHWQPLLAPPVASGPSRGEPT